MQTTTDLILKQFESFRQPATNIDQYEQVGRQVLAERINPLVEQCKPLKFAMLGFPFKSTNLRDKVLSPYPDMGEQLTLKNFFRMNNEIKKVYPPGMILSIVSDGFVFNDLWNIPDAVTAEYLGISTQMGYENSAPVDWYNLSDFYSRGQKLNTMRDKMQEQFGISEEELQRRIMFDQDVNYTYRGMIMFISEEFATTQFESGKAKERAVKSLVRKVMLRNEAFDNMVRHVFKDHIRLSMHKSVNNGKKYSINLIDSPYAKHSAWHSAVVFDHDKVMTMHKKDAVNQGYELVNVNGQPFYFTSKK